MCEFPFNLPVINTSMIKDMVRMNQVVCFRRCVQIIHKLICYQKKCRIRVHYTWRDFWSGMITMVCV